MAKTYKKNDLGYIDPVWYERLELITIGLLGLSTVSFAIYKALECVNVIMKELMLVAITTLTIVLIISIYSFIKFIIKVKKLGSLKIYIKSKQAENMITAGLVDVLAINTMKQTNYFKVPAVAIAPSYCNGWGWHCEIEKLAGMRDLEMVKETINSSLIGNFKNFAVTSAGETKDGTQFIFELENVNVSQTLIIKHKKQLEPKFAYKIKAQKGLEWDISKAPHALIAGDSGTGKTAVLMTLILQFLTAGADVSIIDPKNEFLFLESIMPKGSIVRSFDDVLLLLEQVTNQMLERNKIIAEQVKARKAIGLTGADIGMKPLIIVIDEVGSLVAGIERKQLNQFIGYLTQLVQMGRSSLTNVILTTQQPNAQIISTAIRDQLSFRVLMGKPSTELKSMVFGHGVDLSTEFIDPYTGYYVMAGDSVQPTKFYGINLFENNLNTLSLYESCYRRGLTKEFNY